MADFIEITDGFNLTKALDEDSWSGTRVFRQVDNPSSSMTGRVVAENLLPNTGDVWPPSRDLGLTIPANLKCRSIDYGIEGGDYTRGRIIVFNYATKDQSAQNQPDQNTDSQALNISSVYRLIDLSKVAGAQQIKDANGNALKQLNIHEIQANYTYTQVGYSTFQDAVSSSSAPGKINAAAGNWLSLGVNVSQYESDGNIRFNAARSYSYKKITGPVGRIEANADGWNGDWDTINAKWVVATINKYDIAAFVDTMPTIPT